MHCQTLNASPQYRHACNGAATGRGRSRTKESQASCRILAAHRLNNSLNDSSYAQDTFLILSALRAGPRTFLSFRCASMVHKMLRIRHQTRIIRSALTKCAPNVHVVVMIVPPMNFLAPIQGGARRSLSSSAKFGLQLRRASRIRIHISTIL